MHAILQVDWKSVFIPSGSLLEIVLRGTLTYLFLLVVMRVARREGGSLNFADVLVIVIIADAAQNAMAGEYKSFTEGATLVATIAFWSYSIDWLSYRSPRFARLLQSPPLPLIKDGNLLRRNMRKEMVTEDELMAQLRKQGVDDVDDVKKCCLESDGQISVITKDSKQHQKSEQKTLGG